TRGFGRGRLPTWVVRMRSVESFMRRFPMASYTLSEEFRFRQCKLSMGLNHRTTRARIAQLATRSYICLMKTITVRIPEPLFAEIEAESRDRRISKSDIVRERLETRDRTKQRRSHALDAISDLIGSVHGLPPDLSTNVKKYLRETGYGR